MPLRPSVAGQTFSRFSPSSVDTLRALTVNVKHRCLVEVLHRGVRLTRCYLQCTHASRNRRSAFRLRRLAKSAWARRVLLATALSLWCRAHFRTGGHLSWQAQGKPRAMAVQSRLFVTGARDRSGFTSKCRFRGKCSTLDMVVIFDAL